MFGPRPPHLIYYKNINDCKNIEEINSKIDIFGDEIKGIFTVRDEFKNDEISIDWYRNNGKKTFVSRRFNEFFVLQTNGRREIDG